MGRLLLLFILVPIAELALLLEIGRHVGLMATLLLIVATGALGAYLARRQGLGVLARIQSEMNEGRLPTGQLLDGALILVAGAVLMTPGVLTDVLGFFCLVPAGRRLLKDYLKRRFESSLARGNIGMNVTMAGGFGGPWGTHTPEKKETRDVTPRRPRPERLPRGPTSGEP